MTETEKLKALKAGAAITKLIYRKNGMKRQPCSVCNFPFADAHHEDYDKPLEVIWLCRKHHKDRHRELSGKPKTARSPICFEDAYYNLSYWDRFEIRDSIIKETKWSIQTFNNKRSGKTYFKKSEIPVIKEVFNRYNINPWNGERI